MNTKASRIAKPRRGVLERKAVALAKHCPVDRTNPESCPLCNLRLMSVRQRRTWIHGLTLVELRYLLIYHANCSIVRTRRLKRARAKL